ncbi:MAG: ATP-dependent zinc metalloprotease FtsH [Deltaproteobacteria bacterium]|nr:MAG: ATP-dependent zinc metalloprotease FtsH [Deltaproteobacteria bacterium]
MKQSHKSILLWLLLIAVVVIIVQIITADDGPTEEIAFSNLRAAIEAGAVEQMTIHGDGRITGELREDAIAEWSEEGIAAFETVGRVSDDLQDVLVAQGVEFTFRREEPSLWTPILTIALPLLLILFIFFFFMRQLQGGGGKAMSFGKSRAKLLNENQNKVTFADISGVEEAKEELQEIIEFLRDPKRFTRLGGRIPKGVLLMGPPGTGKTLLARGVAGEAGVPFFSISGSDFVEMFVGVGASRVRDLFEQGKKHAPCIIFIDEIDAVGRHRGAGMGGGHDEREQTLNQLLVEMDGFESNEGVILIAATNRPDVLDPALLRPGRFDRRVVVPRPDIAGRKGILEVHTRRTPLDPAVDLDQIARGTPGFSGADLENLVNEAALIAARLGKDRLEPEDFETARDKVLMGAERRTAVISERDRRVTAFHEAGHALVAALLPEGRDVDPVHKVTIIPRGRALGVMQQLPSEDRLNVTREWALNRIAIAMGGRIAEELVFGQITTGASSDIQQATDMARNMVCDWGMSERLGPIHYGDGKEEVFLGRDYNRTSRGFSERTAIEIDEEVRNIVQSSYDRARQLLRDNMTLLEEVASALLEFEVVDAEEIRLFVEGRGEEARVRRRLQRAEKAAEQPRPGTSYADEDEEDEASGRVTALAGSSPASSAGT